MPQAQTYQSEFTGQEMDARFTAVAQLTDALDALTAVVAQKYVKPASGIPSTDLDADVNAALAKANSAVQSLADYYTKSEVDQLLAAINSMDYVDVAALPTASASTMGKIYLVGPDGSGYYAYYFTSYDGSAYSWVGPLGTTEISMANYATKAELSQLDQKLEERVFDDKDGSFEFSDGNGNLAAKIDENGVKAVDFLYPDGTTIKQSLGIETENNKTVEVNLDGEDGEFHICDQNLNDAISISKDGKVKLVLDENSGADFDFDAPDHVFGIESGTRMGREYFTNIYPEAMVRSSIPVLIDGAKKAVLQKPKAQGFVAQDITTDILSFKIGGNGYKPKPFFVKYVRANRNLAAGKNIGVLCIGDSMTEISTYFPTTPSEKYGRGAWQDWMLAFSTMDHQDVPTLPTIKLIGTKNYHPYSIEYNGETLPYYGHAEGVSGWSSYGYLNYPCFARLTLSSNGLDAIAMYYAAGLATETPFDSTTPGHAFVAYAAGTYDEAIVHTPMGRFKPDCCSDLWTALKRLFADFAAANPGNYSSETSDPIIVAYLEALMDAPTNPFYDKGRARAYTGAHSWTYENAFSLSKYLERYRNCDDSGTPLVGNPGATVTGSDGNTYTIGTTPVTNSQVFMPTHAISALGTNDGDFYVDSTMELLNELKIQGVPHVGHWRVRRPGVLNPQIWNEYGLQHKLTEFLAEKNNAIVDAIGELDKDKVINYIPAFFTASPVSTGFLDSIAGDLDYMDKQGVVCGTDTVHPSAYFMRSVAYQCLAWIYWTCQS